MKEHLHRVMHVIGESRLTTNPYQLDTMGLPFSQSSEKDYYSDGVGIGLAMSFRILRLMESELHMESTLGRGTRCWFDLPVSENDDRPPVPQDVGQHSETVSTAEASHQHAETPREDAWAEYVLPPSAVMDDLLSCAERGNIKQIVTILNQREQDDRQYRPFVRKLQHLARDSRDR